MYAKDQRIQLLNYIGWVAIAICIGLFLLGTISPLALQYNESLRQDHLLIVLYIFVCMFLMFKSGLHIALVWPLVLAGSWIQFLPSMELMERVHPYPLFSDIPFPFGKTLYVSVLALILFGGYGMNFWIWPRR